MFNGSILSLLATPFRLPHFALLLATLCGVNLAFAGEQVSTEYKLKSVLLYKLTRFVEWPAALSVEKSDFKICLLGRDDFGSALQALEQHQVAGKQIKVLRFDQSEQIDTDCRIVFVSSSKQPFIPSIIQRLAPYPILTVGESDGFAQQGGMIQFALKNKKISFEINNHKVLACKLKIAAPLLQMSTIVKAKQ
jgi:hypothetical protein